MDGKELFSVLSDILNKHPNIVKPLTSYLRSLDEDAVSKGIQWLADQVSAPSCNAFPRPPPSQPQISSDDATYPDPVSYFTPLKVEAPGMKVDLLIDVAKRVLAHHNKNHDENHDELAQFQALYDPQQKGRLRNFWNLVQPTGTDSHTLVLRVVSFLDTDNKVQDRILTCVLSRFIDKEEEKLRKNGVSMGRKYRTLARNATAPAGAIPLEWGKKVKRYDLIGQRWRLFEPGCLIGLGGVAISRGFERLNECDIQALISWLRKLPQYEKWTALSPLAMKLEKAFYDPQAQADTGLNSPCPSPFEAVRPPSPNTFNGIPEPCGASDHDSAVSEVGDTTGLNDDGPSTYVANTEELPNVDGPRKRRKLNGDRLSHGADRGSTPDSSSVTVEDNQAQDDSSAESNISTDVLSPTSLDVIGSSATGPIGGGPGSSPVGLARQDSLSHKHITTFYEPVATTLGPTHVDKSSAADPAQQRTDTTTPTRDTLSLEGHRIWNEQASWASHSRETNLANHIVDDPYTSRSRDGNESEVGGILDEHLTTKMHQRAWTMPDPGSGLNDNPTLVLTFGNGTASSSPHSDSFRMEESLLGTLTDGSYEQEAMREWESAYWHPDLGLQYCWRNGTSLGNE